MVEWGYSPSVRLFEAAGCGCPIISDPWPGLDTIFKVGDEVLVAERAQDVIQAVQQTDDAQLRKMGARARERVLEEHSSGRRAEQFESYVGSITRNRVPVASPILASARAASRGLQTTGA
jgi:spore maturation protein CgeB